jgi:hypothetical protein
MEVESMQSTPLSPADDASVQQILSAARSDTVPHGWYVWHLRRDRVLRAAGGWALIAVFGFALLIPATLATVPSNFQHGAGLAGFTIILLGVLGTIAIGGLALGIWEILRLLRADAYLLVMTPTDFLQVAPGRVVYVPMTAVAFVTLKGVKPTPAEQDPSHTLPSALPRWNSIFSGDATIARQRRSSPSLAFLDQRTKSTVVVATDDAFDDLPVLEEILNLYARGEQSPPERGRRSR